MHARPYQNVNQNLLNWSAQDSRVKWSPACYLCFYWTRLDAVGMREIFSLTVVCNVNIACIMHAFTSKFITLACINKRFNSLTHFRVIFRFYSNYLSAWNRPAGLIFLNMTRSCALYFKYVVTKHRATYSRKAKSLNIKTLAQTKED